MTPDIRFYLRLTRSTDDAEETINVNTDKLLQKNREGSGTIVWEEELTVFNDEGNTSWALKERLTIHHYQAIASKLAKLTPQSELVIRGHGNITFKTCCRIGATSLAVFLLEAGLKASCRINITGCNLGRNYNVPIANLATESNAATVGTGSFAHELQAALWKYGKLTPAIHARTVSVIVEDDGHKETLKFSTAHLADKDQKFVHKQRHSKIIFRIDHGGAQYMVWAY